MEGAMVSAFSGAMGSLLSKLAGLLAQDIKLARGLKADIVSLRDEMSTINASLMELSRMEEPIDDALHRELRSKVRELAYDMEDCLDISMHRLGGNASCKAGFLRELKTLRGRSEIAKLITALKARVAQLRNRHQLIIQLPERPRPRAAVRVDPRIRALYQDAASLQGIGGRMEKLVELLQDGAPQLKVVSILGTGGIGKTTLAKQVYAAIQDKFDCAAFVSMSRNPDLAKILSDIIQQCRWHSRSQDGENKLISDLRQRLQNGRYLIIIDDMWTKNDWNIIKCCFVENNRGSRVITTTRIEDTANSCSSSFHNGYVYKMEPLNDVDSRILFHKRIFDSEDACPEHLKSISNEILKKCGGLPLAILTIGSILASDQEVGSMKTWEKIVHSFHFQMQTSPDFEWLRHVFNLGYNDLSLELKTCMLYLGVFPEDHKIVKDDLLRRWLAEGFVTKKHGDIQEEEEIAESYFSELINRSMIQLAEFDDCGEVFSCRVHDMLLDYIILKCTEENFVTVVHDQQQRKKGPLDVRRLSLQVKHSERNGVLENLPLTQARSFNFWGVAQCLPSLTKFRLLRVLYLDIYGSMDRRHEYDMSCIHSLFQLRYLRTNGIGSNKKLVTQLRKLEQLKTLEVGREHDYFVLDAQMLPPTLRHLIVPAGVCWTLAGGIGHLRNLRTLSQLEIDLEDVGRMKDLGELTNLRELKLFRCSYGVGHTSEVLLSSLCKLVNLGSIVIRGYLHDDVLARWSPPPRHLRRLHVLECLFSTIPADWITQLHDLRSLEIKVGSLPSDGIDVLARLTLLAHLKLHVEERVPQEGFVVFHRAAFPHLRELWFRWEAPCLVFEAGTMPRLRSLAIDCYAFGARQTDGVLDGIEHLGSLVDFKVNVYLRQRYIPMGYCCADGKRQRVEEQRRWNGVSLPAALKEAISKHPGSLHVVIEMV